MKLHEGPFPLAYVLPVIGAFVVLFAFPLTRGFAEGKDRRTYWALQGITLLGALAGAKLAVLMGDRLWPVVPITSFREVLESGRSIVGGLIFGFLAAEAAKPLLGYTLPPNDRFAMAVPFSIATGRLGCLFQGCCRGVPWDGPLAITYSDGIPRHPAPLYEILFQLAIGGLFVFLLRRHALAGRLFAVYLVGYGGFRFATEFLRVTPRVFGAFSVYQALSVVMVGLGVASWIRHTPRTSGALAPG